GSAPPQQERQDRTGRLRPLRPLAPQLNGGKHRRSVEKVMRRPREFTPTSAEKSRVIVVGAALRTGPLLQSQGRFASLRDGLRPPLTSEPLRPLSAAFVGQAPPALCPTRRPHPSKSRKCPLLFFVRLGVTRSQHDRGTGVRPAK